LPSLLTGFTSAHLGDFKRELNSAVLKDMRSNKDHISVTVLAVDITRKESEYDRKALGKCIDIILISWYQTVLLDFGYLKGNPD